MSIDELMEEILSDPFANVTFSGGDPLYQVEEFTKLARRIKRESDKTIWCYTGFFYEDMLHNTAYREFLKYIDVLVDGPFILAQRDEELLFRGSSNQRLVDVAASQRAGYVVLWKREEIF